MSRGNIRGEVAVYPVSHASSHSGLDMKRYPIRTIPCEVEDISHTGHSIWHVWHAIAALNVLLARKVTI